MSQIYTKSDSKLSHIAIHLHCTVKIYTHRVSKKPDMRITLHNSQSVTVKYLRQVTLEFIFPDLWPPNNPDLNPVDYKIWGCFQDQVYQNHIFNVD